MKKNLLFFIFAFVALSMTLLAVCCENAEFILEDQSEDCPHGRKVIFKDTDCDGEYDTVRHEHCDGSYSEGPMIVTNPGGGTFDQGPDRAEVLDGDVLNDYYNMRLFDPDDNSNLGHLVKTAGDPVAKFTFSTQ
jgi:hypothetical protein